MDPMIYSLALRVTFDHQQMIDLQTIGRTDFWLKDVASFTAWPDTWNRKVCPNDGTSKLGKLLFNHGKLVVPIEA